MNLVMKNLESSNNQCFTYKKLRVRIPYAPCREEAVTQRFSSKIKGLRLFYISSLLRFFQIINGFSEIFKNILKLFRFHRMINNRNWAV